LIANLLYWYKGYFHDIYVFSPTVLSDEKWDWLKTQKLLSENKDLKRWIKKEQQKRDGLLNNEIIGKPPVGMEFDDKNTNEKEIFDGLIPEENFFHQYTEETLDTILARQKQIINALKKHNQPKYLADRILLIFDDLVGSALFSNAKDNLFKGFNTRHRHYSASVLMVSQGYKEIPKTIRTNWTSLVLFEIANDKEVAVIYEENTMGLKKNDWYEMFNHCTKEPYGFMYLNIKKPKHLRCMKNFDKYLFHKEEEEEGTFQEQNIV
jgi:Poxvirus A32 protein